jgi:hypothetical protein
MAVIQASSSAVTPGEVRRRSAQPRGCGGPPIRANMFVRDTAHRGDPGEFAPDTRRLRPVYRPGR